MCFLKKQETKLDLEGNNVFRKMMANRYFWLLEERFSGGDLRVCPGKPRPIKEEQMEIDINDPEKKSKCGISLNRNGPYMKSGKSKTIFMLAMFGESQGCA